MVIFFPLPFHVWKVAVCVVTVNKVIRSCVNQHGLEEINSFLKYGLGLHF
jgi:hypothetical protein